MVFVHEVFVSIQGEGNLSGHPFVFIRLSGCNLRCKYCDTPEAWEGGVETSVIELADRAYATDIRRVMVTGGEPLSQEEGKDLVDALVERGLSVTVETNGSIELEHVNPAARIVMDVKTPGSGEQDSTNLMNLKWLKETDEIKFVLTGREDYNWAKSFCKERSLLNGGRTIHFSPVPDSLSPADLAAWILADKLNVRINLQLHKIIWPGGEPKNNAG